MVPHASIKSESEVSIAVLWLLCSPRYTAVQIKNYSKSTSVIKLATMKDINSAALLLSSKTKVSISLSAMFNLSYSSTNQELFKKHLCNQGS